MPTPVKAASTVTSPPMRASFQDGRMGTPRGTWPATTLSILTQIRVFVKAKRRGRASPPGAVSAAVSASPERVFEGLVEAREPKRIAGGSGPGRHGVAAIEQQVGLRAEHQSKQRRGRRNDSWAVQHPADFAGNLPLAPDVRGDRVHRSADLWILQRQAIQPYMVIDMDPRKPLAAVAQRPAGEHAEREREQSKGQSTATEDERGAKQHYAHTERLRPARRGLPVLADPSQERVARLTLLGDELVATVAVVVDP